MRSAPVSPRAFTSARMHAVRCARGPSVLTSSSVMGGAEDLFSTAGSSILHQVLHRLKRKRQQKPWDIGLIRGTSMNYLHHL